MAVPDPKCILQLVSANYPEYNTVGTSVFSVTSGTNSFWYDIPSILLYNVYVCMIGAKSSYHEEIYYSLAKIQQS